MNHCWVGGALRILHQICFLLIHTLLKLWKISFIDLTQWRSMPLLLQKISWFRILLITNWLLRVVTLQCSWPCTARITLVHCYSENMLLGLSQSNINKRSRTMGIISLVTYKITSKQYWGLPTVLKRNGSCWWQHWCTVEWGRRSGERGRHVARGSIEEK